MNAEILTGTAFSIYPQSSISIPINETKTTTWLWYIKALQTGDHKIAVNISVPVMVDNKESKYPLENLEFIVNVTPQLPLLIETPTPTSSTLSGSGSGSGVRVQLTKETIDAITAIIGLLTAIIGYFGIKKIRGNTRKKGLRNTGKEIGATPVKNRNKRANSK